MHALEAPHLDAQHDLFVENGAFAQVAVIAPVQTHAPAATGWTRRYSHDTASLHEQLSPPLDAADDSLAHLRENAIN